MWVGGCRVATTADEPVIAAAAQKIQIEAPEYEREYTPPTWDPGCLKEAAREVAEREAVGMGEDILGDRLDS